MGLMRWFSSQKLPVSVWRERKTDVWVFFCPLCKADRRLPFQPGFGRRRQVLQIGITSSFLSLLSWKWFSWKGIVWVLPVWMFYEGLYRWRTRGALRCSGCGFDPYLLKIDQKWAKREIEEFWKKKFAEKGVPVPASKQKQQKQNEKTPERSTIQKFLP